MIHMLFNACNQLRQVFFRIGNRGIVRLHLYLFTVLACNVFTCLMSPFLFVFVCIPQVTAIKEGTHEHFIVKYILVGTAFALTSKKEGSAGHIGYASIVSILILLRIKAIVFTPVTYLQLIWRKN